MAQLRATEYGGDLTKHARELRWLMCQNPTGTGHASLAFLSDNQLAGMVLNVPVPLVYHNKHFTGCMSVNVLTRADQRGKGLFTRQARLVCDQSLACGYQLIFGFPNANAAPGWRKLGHTFIGSGETAKKPIHLLSWLSNKVNLPAFLRGPWLDETLSRAISKHHGGYQVLETLEGVYFKPRIDPTCISIYTDPNWLSWRYVASPQQYTLLTVGKRNHPEAISIVRTATNLAADGREVTFGILMDVIAADSASEGAELNAILSAISWLRDRGCHSVKSLFVRGTRYEGWLRNAGFWLRRTSGQEQFIVRTADSVSFPRNIKCFSISYSWADWV